MFSKLLSQLYPYTPGEQPQDKKYIKLNTNENPYPPCPEILKMQIAGETFRLYPDPQCTKLREALADTFRVPPPFIFVGNGSDEILSFAFGAFFDSSMGELLFPQHTYSFYPVYCRFYNLSFRQTKMNQDFSIDCSDFWKSQKDTGVIFPNPNAPTGIALSRQQIREILEKRPSNRVVIVDEAYIDFGGESVVELTREFDNLLVIGTFSKSRSLAGLRLGYAVGSPLLIEALQRMKDSFNSYTVNRFTQECAIAALRNVEYFQKCCTKIIETRKFCCKELEKRGWSVLPSQANFLFAAHPTLSGEEVYRRLKDEGVLVRHFNHQGIENRLRITIGTDEEMKSLLKIIDRW